MANSISKEAKEVLEALAKHKNVLISGAPATGKSRVLNEVAEAFINFPDYVTKQILGQVPTGTTLTVHQIQDLVRANFTLTSADWEIHTNTRPTNYRKWLHRIQGVLAEYKRKYTTRAGTKITKWRCGSCNKTDGHKVCSNRYVTDETFTKLFVMGWNEIVEHRADYQERWQENIKGDDVLLRYKTKLLMKHAAAGPIKEFDPELMMAVMDYITVYEDGRLQIKFYEGTEFEVAIE